ncbi:MAG: hypothetical protein JXR59_11740 [Desulfuromonadaceae bacterium]|nr:hypothetical protein [Desulfuromonadaceae bacterium]
MADRKGKIISISPAPNHLHAVYIDVDDSEEIFDPVICLAVIEDDDGHRHIEAMVHDAVGGIERAADSCNFERLDWRRAKCQCSAD